MFQLKWFVLMFVVSLVAPRCAEYAPLMYNVTKVFITRITNYDCEANAPKYLIELLDPVHIVGLSVCIPGFTMEQPFEKFPKIVGPATWALLYYLIVWYSVILLLIVIVGMVGMLWEAIKMVHRSLVPPTFDFGCYFPHHSHSTTKKARLDMSLRKTTIPPIDVTFRVRVPLRRRSPFVVQLRDKEVDPEMTMREIANDISLEITRAMNSKIVAKNMIYVPFGFAVKRGFLPSHPMYLDEKTNQPPRSPATWGDAKISQLRDQARPTAPVNLIIYGDTNYLPNQPFLDVPEQRNDAFATPPESESAKFKRSPITPEELADLGFGEVILDPRPFEGMFPPTTPMAGPPAIPKSKRDRRKDDEEEDVGIRPVRLDPVPKFVFDDDLRDARKSSDAFDDLLGGGRERNPKFRRTKCSICKSKEATLRHKDNKDIKYCGKACYLKDSQKKE